MHRCILCEASIQPNMGTVPAYIVSSYTACQAPEPATAAGTSNFFVKYMCCEISDFNQYNFRHSSCCLASVAFGGGFSLKENRRQWKKLVVPAASEAVNFT